MKTKQQRVTRTCNVCGNVWTLPAQLAKKPSGMQAVFGGLAGLANTALLAMQARCPKCGSVGDFDQKG